ncbi:MAG: BC1881 family protein [Eubacterium sp.]
MKNIKDYKTCELVEELKKREGVEYDEIRPYVEKDLGVISGPAIVLTVID